MSRFDEKRLLAAGVPRRQREEIGREDFDSSRPGVAEACKFFPRSDPRPFLVLAGAVGVGKSDAAAYALADVGSGRKWVTVVIEGRTESVEVSGAPPSIRWVHAFELVKASTYDRDFWAKVERPDLLVIDDLGAQPLDGKGFAAANIANLLCYRESQDAKTLITTNLTWDQFAADYCQGPGERVRDRLRRYPGMFFQVPGTSLRRAS